MSFSAKIKEIQPSLSNFIKSRIYNPYDAQDLLQNVNLILLNKKSEYDESKSFSGWAFKIAKFQIMAFLSHSKRSRLILTAMDDEASSYLDSQFDLNESIDLSSDHDPPSSIIQNKEKKDRIDYKIEVSKKRLSKNQLNIIDLYSQGKSVKEIAHELNMKISTVCVTKSRAIEKMKKIIW